VIEEEDEGIGIMKALSILSVLLERADKSLDEMERPDQPYPQLQVEERPERL